jgi:cytochrome c peroxidase
MSKPLSALSGGMMLVLAACGSAAQDGETERTMAIEGESGGSEELSSGSGEGVEGLSPDQAYNSAGIAETVHLSGSVDRTNAFFQPIGTNPRTCETCHGADQGWTLTAQAATMKFFMTAGTDPLFNLVDTGSRVDADVSTFWARLNTYQSTLLNRGLIRFTRAISPTAEFAVTAVNDPYGWSTTTSVSSFRRPTPTANESKSVSNNWTGGPHDPFVATAQTSAGASRLHLQRVEPVSTELANSMRDLQFGIVFAQIQDRRAGRLDADGAKGGPVHLKDQVFYPGINDLQGNDPQGKPFTRKVFDIYDAWSVHAGESPWSLTREAARGAIYRGQEIFNHFEFPVSGVTGLNDVLGASTVQATCSTCHNVPNVGGHAVFRMFDMGTANPERCSPALPMLTLQNKTTGEVRQVCDMGKATQTGKWADIGGFRAPPLRGLAARAPYFHDGQMRNIRAVIDYYQSRFNMGLTVAQKRDLEAFLRAL